MRYLVHLFCCLKTISRFLRLLGGAGALMLVAACSGNVEDAMAQAAQAQRLLEAGDIANARRQIRLAIQERDDIAALHMLNGRIEYAAGSPEAAFAAFSQAADLDASNPEILSAKAQLGMSSGHLYEAGEAADKLLDIQPENDQALVIKGVIQLVRRRPAQALPFAERVLEKDPNSEIATILKSRALFLMGRRQEAISLAQAFATRVGQTEPINRTLIEMYRAESDAAGVQRMLSLLRAEHPKDWVLLLDQATVDYKTGRAAEARTAVAQLMAQEPLSLDQAEQVVAVWREFDQQPLSVPQTSAVARIQALQTRQVLARYMIEAGRIDLAEILLERGDDATSSALRAWMKEKAGDRTGALAQAQQLLAQDETLCDALLVKARLSNLQQAIIAAQTASAECADIPEAHLVLANAYRAKGDATQVERVYDNAVRALPQNAQLAATYSDWLISQGQTARAVRTARRLTRNAPASGRAWRVLASVCARVPSAGCSGEAEAGAARSLSILAMDRPVGMRTPVGLYGPMS